MRTSFRNACADLVPIFWSSRKVIIPNRGPHSEENDMRKKTFSEGQIALALREAEDLRGRIS